MKWVVGIICIFLAMAPSASFSWGGPENVLVVKNSNSPTSIEIADYYVAKRKIPANNVCTISCQDSALSYANEMITATNYTNLIETPIKNWMTSKGITNTIQYIVLTKGIPIYRTVSGARDYFYDGYSVDSCIAAMSLTSRYIIGVNFSDGTNSDTAYYNRYWRTTTPFQHSTYGAYLVTRLDAYTLAEAKALVDRAIAPQTPPYHILLDVDPNRGTTGDPTKQPQDMYINGVYNPNYALDFAAYNADIVRASQVIAGRPWLNVSLDQTTTFVGATGELGGYVSWGSNDAHYSATTYRALQFAPGSVVETAVSTSGRTFYYQMTYGQSQIADLITGGAMGVKGYVIEPFLHAVASPTVLLDYYTSGRNLAESYYAASRLLKWKDIVIGDPLATMNLPIGYVKTLPDGTFVHLSEKHITAGTTEIKDGIYVSEKDRSAGIKVVFATQPSGYTNGMTVWVNGTLATVNGERVLNNASIVYYSSIL